jgi:penicillin-insensitive murein endopeptidase
VSSLTAPPPAVRVERSPDSPAALLYLSDEELARRLDEDPASIGSLSIGTPGSAVLFNSVQLHRDPRWDIGSRAITFGTSETMEAIQTVVGKVFELFPDSPPILIGDISDEDGGRLKRHESHQGGRDVDFGFYFKSGKADTFVTATAANLDLPRNWALVRAMITCTDVQTILLDTRIQRVLYKYALSISEDKDWLDRVFGFARGYRDAIIKHVKGHKNHYHVRFFNPVAQELGRRVHPILVEKGLMKPPVFTIKHVVRRGQTLGHIARIYGVSTTAIQQANRLSSTRLRAGRAYRVPVRAAVSPGVPIVIPQRKLPPGTPADLAGVDWPTPEQLYRPDDGAGMLAAFNRH